jgi:hypothetical protein
MCVCLLRETHKFTEYLNSRVFFNTLLRSKLLIQSGTALLHPVMSAPDPACMHIEHTRKKDVRQVAAQEMRPPHDWSSLQIYTDTYICTYVIRTWKLNFFTYIPTYIHIYCISTHIGIYTRTYIINFIDPKVSQSDNTMYNESQNTELVSCENVTRIL